MNIKKINYSIINLFFQHKFLILFSTIIGTILISLGIVWDEHSNWNKNLLSKSSDSISGPINLSITNDILHDWIINSMPSMELTKLDLYYGFLHEFSRQNNLFRSYNITRFNEKETVISIKLPLASKDKIVNSFKDLQESVQKIYQDAQYFRSLDISLRIGRYKSRFLQAYTLSKKTDLLHEYVTNSLLPNPYISLNEENIGNNLKRYLYEITRLIELMSFLEQTALDQKNSSFKNSNHYPLLKNELEVELKKTLELINYCRKIDSNLLYLFSQKTISMFDLNFTHVRYNSSYSINVEAVDKEKTSYFSLWRKFLLASLVSFFISIFLVFLLELRNKHIAQLDRKE
ncbi:MAG: hypothetical protein HQK49_10790 [Oligoflexia bacterium]|nr:hypothetical protein [Oligoflexia bacterium]